MLTRQSLGAAFGALARMLSVAGRAATLLLRRSGHAAPARHTPHSRGSAGRAPSQPAVTAALRRHNARATVSPPATTPLVAGEAVHSLHGEYRVLPISAIAPAATPTRLVYDGIERLAASIAGGPSRKGVGLMAPVIVRLLDNGEYECVDGERRLRACRLIAERAGAEDCLIPAIVFSVSARVAQHMRVAALDVPEPTPIELALTYRALSDAVEEEGEHACSARGLTLVSHHGKTQLAGYLRIADAISDQVMVAAGLVTSDGHSAPEALVELTNNQLLDAAKGDTVEARAVSLKGHLDRACGRAAKSSRQSTQATESPTENGAAITSTRGEQVFLTARTRTMPPSEARALIENEVAPAMIALVEQAHGGRDAEGYYSAFTTGHACLVLPRQVEGLTLEQLDRLDHALALLTARTRRAREGLLHADAMFAPLGERKSS